MLNFNVCVVQCCSDGSINNQEYKSFAIDAVTIKKSMTEYSSFNKTVGLTLYSNTAVYGGNQYGKSGSLVYFHSFEALYDAIEVQIFSRCFIFTPFQRHW